MKTEIEIKEMIHKLWKIEIQAPVYLKEHYAHASEVLEWVLNKRDAEEVILFGE